MALQTHFKICQAMNGSTVAKSEYLFKRLQPPMDDLFYLGSDYQQAFERFEVIYALQHVSISDSGWGPIGRFGYRRKVYSDFLAEADREGQQWPLLKAGLFGGTQERFKAACSRFQNTLSHINHWM